MENECMKHGGMDWFELMTTDVEGAKRFYGNLFGWEFKDAPMESGGTYTMVKVDGKPIAGIMARPEECKCVPPSWDVYVTVDDVDSTAEAINASGGKVLRAPADIPGIGRFCVLQDPQGATLMAITYIRQ